MTLFRCSLLFTILIFSILNLGEAATASDAYPARPRKPALDVFIAVTKEHGINVFELSTADPHIDVVIQNVSDVPQEFLGEDCSGGYDNLRLMIFSIDGKALPEPITVERVVTVWERNPKHIVTLDPGGVMVREVHFKEDRSFCGIPYRNFPQMTAGQVHKFRMCAVLTVQTSHPSPGFWSGSIASKTEDYEFDQYSP